MCCKISFFAQAPYVVRHLQRVSTIIRAEQIALEIGARLNPRKDYQDGVCVYVKPNIKPEMDFLFEGKAYLDMVDGFGLVPTMQKYPEIPVIAYSDADMETLSRYVKNRLVLIPHHHCNFEREVRQREGISKVGVIGSPGAFDLIPKEIKDGLAKRKIKYLEHSTFFPRTTVTKYYKGIDVALVWRPNNRPYKDGSYNPFKIVNASAFGVPTIALDEPAFKEMEGCYRPVNTVDEFFKELDALISSKTLYDDMTKVCLEKAEKYHIENIAELYKKL